VHTEPAARPGSGDAAIAVAVDIGRRPSLAGALSEPLTLSDLS
jgi:hypothetical protein